MGFNGDAFKFGGFLIVDAILDFLTVIRLRKKEKTTSLVVAEAEIEEK